MNDLERDLRELLEARAGDASPAAEPDARVLRRARRRQVGTAVTLVLSVAVILGGSIVAVRALMPSVDRRPMPVVPALPNEPEGFRAVALPSVSLSYPDHWSLVSLEPDETRDRILQLANFDLGPAFGACEQGWTLPPGGVLLEVRSGVRQDSVGSWPTSLGVLPGGTEPCGAEFFLGASWQVNGTAYSATGLVSADASDDDVELMRQAFETLTFPEVVPQTEEPIGLANLVLDSAVSPIGPVLLYVYEDLDDGHARATYSLGISGPAGSHLAGASTFGREIPVADEDVTMVLDEWGGVVWGDVAGAAARADLRTVESATYPATLVPLPRSLGLTGIQAVWGFIDEPTSDRVTTLLHDSQGRVMNDHFPTGPRTTIATGEDTEGNPWELYLEATSDGIGLGFMFGSHGGGGGCCLGPLKSDFELDGWGTSTGDPSHITVLASDLVTRLAFEAADGTSIEGALYPVPDGSVDIPQVGLVIVPEDVTPEGHVVGYDKNGNEVGREFVGETGERPGPTPEIDAVWMALRAARDAASRYFERHGSFSDLDLDALVELARTDVTFSTRPEPEAVSVFVGDDHHLAVSSTAVTGEAFCIAVEAPVAPNSSFNYRYGRVFAESYDDCAGGW